MALGPQDISNLNKFGAQLSQSVGQMSGTVSQMHGTLDSFATRLEDILDPEGAFKKGGEKAGKGFSTGVTHAAKTFDKMIGGTASKFVKVIGGAGKGAGLALVGSLVATIFKNFEGVRKTSALSTRNFGMMQSQSLALTRSGQEMTRGLAAYRGQWDLVAQTANNMRGEFLSISRITEDQAEFATLMQQGFGVAAKDTGALMGVMTQGLGLSEKASMGLVGSFQELAEGSGFTFAELVTQAAEGSSVMAAMGRTQLNDYRKLVLYTKQRGISMQKVQAFQEKDADYAKILKNTMRTNILLGTKMDARAIMRAKLQGNYVKFMDLTVGEAIKENSWTDMLMYKKRELANITGLSLKELQKEYLIRRKVAGLATPDETKELQRINAAETYEKGRVQREKDARAIMVKQAGIMDQIKATLLDGIIAPIQKFANDRFGGFEQMLDSILLTAGSIGTKIGEWVTEFLNLDDWKKIAIGIGTIVGPYLIGSMLSGAVVTGAMTGLMGMIGGGGGGGKGASALMKFLGGGGSKFGGMTSTAGKLAGGAGLAISAVQLGKNIYDAFTKQGVKKKKAAGKAIGGAIAGAIGFSLGGPVGAAIGYQIGSSIGNLAADHFTNSADRMITDLEDTVAGMNKAIEGKKGIASILRESIKLGFQEVKIGWNDIGDTILATLESGDAIDVTDVKMMTLINQAAGSLENFLKLSPTEKFEALRKASSELATQFEDTVKSSKKWQDAEFAIKKAEAQISRLELEFQRTELNKKSMALLDSSALGKALQNTGAFPGVDQPSIKEFGSPVWGKALGMTLDVGGMADNQHAGMKKIITQVLKLERTGGVDTKLLQDYLRSISTYTDKQGNLQQTSHMMMPMTHAQILSGFDLFMEQYVRGGQLVEFTKMLQALDLQTSMATSSQQDFIIPSQNDTVIGFDAGKLPMGGDQKEVVAAINNLAAALANRPTVVEIDGNEIVKTIYNKAQNAG